VRDGEAAAPATPALWGRLEAEFGSRSWLAAAVAVAGAAAGFLVSQGLQPCDDAYISFRHARNLASHGRPAWNLEGPAVLGSSSPAFVLLLGGLGALLRSDRVDVLALFVNAALLGLVTLLAYLAMRDLGGRPLVALVAASLIGFNSVVVFVLSQGFEAGLLLVVLLGGLVLVCRRHDGAALLLAGLAPLVRPEGLLLSPLVWGEIVLGRRFRPRLLFTYLAVPLAWVAFAVPYYGSPVPQSIRARAVYPSVFSPYTGGAVDLKGHMVEIVPRTAAFWSQEARSYLFSGYRAPKHRPDGRLSVARLSLLALPWLIPWLWRRRRGLSYLLYAPLFLVFYAWIGYREEWYFPSFVAFSILTLVLACVAALGALLGPLESRWPGVRHLQAVLPLLLLIPFLHASSYGWNDGRRPDKGLLYARDPRGSRFERWERQRYRAYLRVARLLNRERLAPALTSEVGVFGFFYRGPVIDTVGLCSPEALRFYPPPRSDIFGPDGRPLSASDNIAPTAMVLALRPTFVVNGRGYIRNLLRPGSPFLGQYAFRATLGSAWNEPLMLFQRLDTLPPGAPRLPRRRSASAHQPPLRCREGGTHRLGNEPARARARPGCIILAPRAAACLPP
jgi:hypothetical protein